jgi:hypothetical protein
VGAVGGGAIAGPEGAAAGAIGGSGAGESIGEGAGEAVGSLAETAKGDDSAVVGAVRKGVSAGQAVAAGKVPGVTDATLSWGRSGEIETTVGHGDTPTLPQGSGVSGMEVSSASTSTQPDTFGGLGPPNRSENRAWNMSDISNYRIGG